MARVPHSLGRRLFDFQMSGKLADFDIISSDNTRHRCHRVVLAAMSPVLETMLDPDGGSGFQEHISNSTSLPFEDDAIHCLIRYMYVGEDFLVTKSTGALYCLAHYLQMEDLVQSCETFLQDKMDKQVCLQVWQASKLYENKPIAGIAKSFVLQNFNQFCNNRDIAEISLEDFAELVKDPYLNSSAANKCVAAWIWFINQESPVTTVCDKLITSLIQAKDVDNGDIKDACNAAAEDDDNIELIPELRRIWTESCAKLIWGGDAKVPLVDSDYLADECLIILGSEEKDPYHQITALNFKQKSWYSFPPHKQEFGYRFAVCAVGGDIFFSGGTHTTHHKQFLCYLPYERRWLPLGTMPNGRENHGMVAVKGLVYVLGGAVSGLGLVIDAFNPQTGQWFVPGELAHGVCSASTAVDGELIYLVGGCSLGKDQRPMNIVQYFNASKSYGCVLNMRLPFTCKMQSTQSACVDGILYIIHKGDIYTFTKDKGPEMVCSIEKPPVRGFGAVEFGDQILIFGGDGDNFQMKTNLIQFDTQSRQVFTLPITLPKPTKEFAFTKVNLKTQVLNGAEEI